MADRDEQSYPSSTRAWWAVLVLFVAYTVSFIDRTILSLMVEPLRRDLHITDTQISLLQGLAFAIFYTTMGLPIATWADRGSRRFIIASGIFFWSLMTAACGLANTFWRLFAARLGVGVGEAALSPATYSLIADLFPENKRGRALGVFASGVNVGAGLAFIIGGTVIGVASKLGAIETSFGTFRMWQLVFIMVGLPGLIVALLALTIHEPYRPRQIKGDGIERGALWRFIGTCRGAIAAHFLGFSLCGMAYTGVASWAPTYLIRHFGFSAAQAGHSLGLGVLFMGTLGALAGGALSDRWVLIKNGTLRIGCIAIILQTVACIVGVLVDAPGLAIGMFSLVFFSGGLAYTAGAAAIQKITPARMRAIMSALYLFVVSLIATALGPTSIALITDKVLNNPAAVGHSMAIVAAIIGPLGLIAFVLGLRPFADAIARQTAPT